MSIVLCILCLNIGVALGMVLSGVLRQQRGALEGPALQRAETD
jgi:hypothetical protein